MIFDNTENRHFRYDVGQNLFFFFFFFFLKSQFFRSAGNILQQIKKSRLMEENCTLNLNGFDIIFCTFYYHSTGQSPGWASSTVNRFSPLQYRLNHKTFKTF